MTQIFISYTYIINYVVDMVKDTETPFEWIARSIKDASKR